MQTDPTKSSDLVIAPSTDLAPPAPRKQNRFKNDDGSWQKIALLSVWSKDGITEFAQGLLALGWSLLSSGGTAKHLRAAGLEVTDVAEVSGLAACLDHKVVTLVPQIHGGLLAADADLEELEKLGWPRIGLFCGDLYPLKDAVENVDATRESVIMKTDIGGPTMLRSAAKGRRITICDPRDRTKVLEWLVAGKPDEDDFVTALCAKTEGIVADYCLTSARYHSMGKIDGLVGTQAGACKYGENPKWSAALYATNTEDALALPRFQLEAGSAPSYINLTDVDRSLRTMIQIAAGFEVNVVDQPKIAIAVKHGNTCGVAVDADPIQAIKKMIGCDPTSIHGASVMVNFEMHGLAAETLRCHLMEDEAKRIIDVVVCTSVTEEAETALERKAGRCRVIANPRIESLSKADLPHEILRPVRGGFLRQWGEPFVLDFRDPQMDVQGSIDRQHELDIVLAWAIGSTSNSNTITLVKNGMLVANAVGQQSRVRAAKLALMIAEESKHDVRGCVAYSDSFFPFPDGPQILLDKGVKIIFASSGSVNDQMVLDAVRASDGNLARLPDKVCRGFAQH